jgi:hypothetical protein
MNFWGMYEEPDKIDDALFISNYSAAKNKEVILHSKMLLSSTHSFETLRP